KTLLGQALAEDYKLPFADLAANPITREQAALIPEDMAHAMRLVVAAQDSTSVTIVTDQPEKIDQSKLTALFPHLQVRINYTLPEYLDEALELYAKPLATRFSKILQESQRVAPEVVDEIIRDALNFKASDIHFEPGG